MHHHHHFRGLTYKELVYILKLQSSFLMCKLLFPLPAHLRRTVFYQIRLTPQHSAPLSTSRTSPLSSRNPAAKPLQFNRLFSSTIYKMSDLSIELTAPNGRKYTQPTGLFINNEWVKSSNGQKITSINPSYGYSPIKSFYILTYYQR
jgi:hypothetical protein